MTPDRSAPEDGAWSREGCCCQWEPSANRMVRCLPRAMDMGHCDERANKQADKPDYCCGEAYPAPRAARWLTRLAGRSRSRLTALPRHRQPTWFRLNVADPSGGDDRGE